jgi:hypothetical protein
MIIEIAERQIGKTERLVEHAFNYLLNGSKDILIVSYNLSASARIKHRIKQKMINFLFKDIDDNDNNFHLYKKTHKVLKQWLRRIKYSTSTWVKDKNKIGFYYIDEIYHIKKDKIEFLNNAYYVGLSYEDITLIPNMTIRFDHYDMPYNDEVIELLYSITTKAYKRDYKIKSIFGEDDIDFYSYVIERNPGINLKFKFLDFKKIYS